MAPSRPVDLCTQLLPTGQLCGGIALRNHHYCRAHISRYRLMERDRQHDLAIFTLRDQLESMDFPELLQNLDTRLNRIRSIVRAYPEARVNLDVVLERLQQINAAESNASSQPQLDQSSELNPSEIKRILATLGLSNT